MHGQLNSRGRALARSGVMSVGLCALLALLFTSLPAGAQGVTYNYAQVVAQAGETLVTRGDVAEAAIAQYGATVLDDAVKKHAFVIEAARRAGVTVTPAEVAQRVAEYKTLAAQFDQFTDVLGTRKVLDAIPAALLDDEMRTGLLAEKLLGITISEADVQAAYETNLDRFRRPLLLDLVVIAVNDSTTAAAALKRVNRGEDPRVVSAELSTEADVRAARGVTGWTAASGFLKPVFRDAVFGVNAGLGLRVKQSTGVLVEKKTVYNEIKRKNEVVDIPPYLIFTCAGVKPTWEPRQQDVMPAARFLARAGKVEAALTTWLKTQDGRIAWKVLVPPARRMGLVDYTQVIAQAGDTPVTRAALAEAVLAEHGLTVLDSDMKTRAFIWERARLNHITVAADAVTKRIDDYTSLVHRLEGHTDIMGTSAVLAATPPAQLEEDTRLSLLAEQVMGITVTDDAVRAWSVKNAAALMSPKRVQLVLIETDTYATARDAYMQLKAGTDARVVAEKYASDPTLAAQRGVIGWYSRSMAQVADAATAIFSPHNNQGLGVGEYTNVIPIANATTLRPTFRIYAVIGVAEYWQATEKDALDAARFLCRQEMTRDAQRGWLTGQMRLITWQRVPTLRDPNATLEVVPPALS
jgi:hypothetical protein